MNRRLVAVVAAVATAMPGGAAGQAVDTALVRYLNSVKAIDNHAHPVSVDPNDRDFDALPIDGFPPFAFPVRLRVDNPELVDAWRDLFGYPHNDRSEAHLADLRALKAKVRSAQGEGYPSWVIDRLNIDVQLANRLALGPGLASPRFRWVSFVDPLLFPLSTKALETNPERVNLFGKTARNFKRYLSDLGVTTLPPSFQGYLDRVVTPTLERMARGGAVAVKYEAPYLRSLDFGPANFAAARATYERYRAGGGVAPASGYRLLQDYLFRYIGREAGRLKLAVHVHSADGAGGYFEARGSDPILLESALNDTSLRRTNFVIVHGGWPHTRNTMSLFAKPNVYADISFLGNLLSAHTLGLVLREWLSAYPERILFGSDAYPDNDLIGWEEWGWLGVTGARRALATALSGMLRDGEISRARAEEIGRMVLRDNAAALYGIR